MRMPATVKVGPHTYTVLRRPAKEMGENIGDCKFDELQIIVSKHLRASKAKEILMHEVLHACTHPSLNSHKRYTDEDFVEGVAPILLQVLQDNPTLVAYLAQ